MTEVEHRLASAHTIPAHTLDLEVSPSVQRRYVEDLEAQWSLDDSDDARAVLDYLQRAVYAQGTSTGLNGATSSQHTTPVVTVKNCTHHLLQSLGFTTVTFVYGLHAVVAMSGGTGSALLAHIVASVFDENTVACIGRSVTVASERLHRARYTADLMGEVLQSPLSCLFHV